MPARQPEPIKSSRRSIHMFDTEAEALQYRADHGTGGWIYVCHDKGEATLFPPQMTPTDIFRSRNVSGSGGRFVGATGKTVMQEDVA